MNLLIGRHFFRCKHPGGWNGPNSNGAALEVFEADIPNNNAVYHYSDGSSSKRYYEFTPQVVDQIERYVEEGLWIEIFDFAPTEAVDPVVETVDPESDIPATVGDSW